MTKVIEPPRQIESPPVFALTRIVAPLGSAVWGSHQLIARAQSDVVTVGLYIIVAVAFFLAFHFGIVLADDRLNRGEP